jgi:hypothetical protein
LSYSVIRNEMLNSAPPAKRNQWFGVFSENVVAFTDLARVILPDYDTTLVWGGCRWQSRDDTSLPQKGDECIVMFDNRNQIWVIAWWPF